jgi:cytochrome c
MKLILLAACLFAPTVLMADNSDLLKAGEKAFRKWKACHKIGEGAKNGVGPALNNIVDMPAGQGDFNYSGALKTAAENGLMWDDASLTAFLKRPRDFVAGTNMSFSGLRKDTDIDAIIALLAANTTKPSVADTE